MPIPDSVRTQIEDKLASLQDKSTPQEQASADFQAVIAIALLDTLADISITILRSNPRL